MTGIRGQESGQEKELGLKAASTMGEGRRENGRSTSISSGLFAIRFLVFFVLSSSLSLQLCIFGTFLAFSVSVSVRRAPGAGN